MRITQRITRAIVVAFLALRFARVAFAGGNWSGELREVSSSGVAGHITLTDNGNSTTTVEINIDRAPPGWGRTSLHAGTHENYNPEPSFRLNDLVDGVSTSQITIPLKELGEKDHVILIEDDSGISVFDVKWITD